ncbi:MAG: hypothetical protein NZ700_03775, partial [Gemmataceae bacterium]|nr:hypothetical protein [Gemmataceae bacterium]
TRFTIDVPAARPDERLSLVTYTRPSRPRPEITVSLRVNGQEAVPAIRQQPLGLPTHELLYVTLGSDLPGLRQALGRGPDPAENVGCLTAVEQMPEHWFGYGGVDLLILTTSNRDFLVALGAGRDERMRRRRAALAEWVERGGRLLVSVGRNVQLLDDLADWQELWPVELEGTVSVPLLRPRWRGGRSELLEALANRRPGPALEPAPVEIARFRLKPERSPTVWMQTADDAPHPLIVAAPFGLGRVTVVALEMDQAPFTDWPAQAEFWRKLLPEAGPFRPIRDRGDAAVGPTASKGAAPDWWGLIDTDLQTFDTIPVVRFGWVAAWVLAYILLIGPLDLVIVKYLLRRPELTWVTFPLMVAVVSLATYLAASWLKGSQRRVNKIDLIDIDLERNAVFGQTWLTLFNPRAERQTIGLEPVSPAWGLTTSEKPAAALVSWWGDASAGSEGWSRGQGLFRQPYDYETHGAHGNLRTDGEPIGLRGVPVPIWSTKSVTGCWRSQLGPGQQLLRAELERRGDGDRGNRLRGKILSRLPITLDAAFLIDAGPADIEVYELGELAPGEAREVSGRAVPLFRWLRDTAEALGGTDAAPGEPRAPAALGRHFWHILWDEAAASLGGRTTRRRDHATRHLDQSWRLRYHREEALLFGWARAVPEDAAPSRLWLGAVPTEGPRPPLSAELRQEVFVRAFVPVRRGP